MYEALTDRAKQYDGLEMSSKKGKKEKCVSRVWPRGLHHIRQKLLESGPSGKIIYTSSKEFKRQFPVPDGALLSAWTRESPYFKQVGNKINGVE